MAKKNNVNKPASRADEVLYMLEKADDWISGEDISKTFNITRAAISKHIVTLREYGHIIESATKRGYKLLFKNHKIDAQILTRKLKTKVLGKSKIFAFEVLGSSNQEAIFKALDNAENGTLILAENQVNGRGTKDHTWFSAPRSLQFSLLLRPSVSNIEMDCFIENVLACIVQVLYEQCGVISKIKKPNDILINNKKVAGVLVETGYRSEELKWLILGIGINVNALKSDFPQDLQGFSTSIYAESNTFVDRTDLLACLLEKIENIC